MDMHESVSLHRFFWFWKMQFWLEKIWLSLARQYAEDLLVYQCARRLVVQEILARSTRFGPLEEQHGH